MRHRSHRDEQLCGICASVAFLQDRVAFDGGFRNHPRQRDSRPDSTAWAVLAVSCTGAGPKFTQPARSSLRGYQREDGRVTISQTQPDVFWPTPLAILAWHGSPEHFDCEKRAAHFLLETNPVSHPKPQNAPYEHDPSLRGWPWVARTQSWVEPTAFAILALRTAGHNKHPRLEEGKRLLIDRQLPSGGWNFGNTVIFASEMRPLPYSTGMVLSALAGEVPRKTVEKSIVYLRSELERHRTPLSLAWGILGLSAWGERPVSADEWLKESLKLQERYGAYNTSLLSLLILAHRAVKGINTLWTEDRN